MEKNLNRNINNLIKGTTFLGTGGGGNPAEALEMFQEIRKLGNNLCLANLADFKETDFFITAFAVGSINAKSDPKEPIQKAFSVLSKKVRKPIRAIIPVEIGPKSVAMAFYLASFLDLPVLDADFVGGRSTPEVFLETISLFGLPRTPLVVVDTNLETKILLKSRSFQEDEKFLRNFASLSENLAYVVGYPLNKRQLEKSVETGTISEAVKIGNLLKNNQKINTKLLFTGFISKIEEQEKEGFAQKVLTISNGQNIAKIFIKNENLILWINDKVVLTCPDLIILLNEKNQPIYNLNLKIGLKVQITGRKSRPLWRSRKGLQLFNPKTFGFNFNPILLT